MVITAIKQQVKNTDRASIFVDGKYSFSLSLNELVTQKLKIGLVIDPPTLKKLQKISTDEKLKQRSLEWLLRRPHSEKELADYFYRKQVDNELGEKIKKDFRAKGYLNDLKFAQWFFESRERKGKSNRIISSELRAKGISSETISVVMSDAKDSEMQRLIKLIDQKSKLSRYQDRRKLTQYLIGKGFSYDDVRQALAET